MKSRLGIVGLAGAAIALGLLAPSVVTAAPKPEKPTGEAMVAIEGGTAYAIDKGNDRYRVVLPRGATIKWMGEVGKELSIGTFTSKALVAGWSRLGHRDSAESLTTITWVDPGATRDTFRLANIGKPRINSKGQVTFLAVVPRGLPEKMPNFSVNIARPAPVVTRTSSYPDDSYIYFPVNMASDTVGMQAIATGDNSATITWFSLDSSGKQTECPTLPQQNLVYPKPVQVKYGTATCGDVTWDASSAAYGTTYVELYPGWPAYNPPVPTEVDNYASFTKSGSSTLFHWKFTMGSWYVGGSLNPP